MKERKQFSSGNNADRLNDSRGGDGGYDDKQQYGIPQNRERSNTDNNRRYGRDRVSDGDRNRHHSRSISPPPHHAQRRNNQSNQRRSRSKSQPDDINFRDSYITSSRGGRGRGNQRNSFGGKYQRDGGDKNESKNTGFTNANPNTGFSYSPPIYDDKKSESFDHQDSRVEKFGDQDSDSMGYKGEGDLSNKLRAGDRVPEVLDPEMREIFPFRIFIKDDYLKEGLASRNETDDIIRQAGINSITMDNQIQVPDFPGQAMIIESNDLQKREDALRMILTNIERIERDFKGKNFRGEIELMTFVPEGLVAVTIGHKGRLISKIKDETGVSVVINQRVRGMTYRSTYATGTPRNLSKACGIMYNTLEEQAYLIKDWDKIKTESISKEDVKLTAKFIVDTEACGFIIGRHGNFTKYLEHNLGIYMRCDKDDNNRILKSYQSICSMKGTLKDIQKGIKELVKRLDEYYKSLSKEFSRFPFNVVIPANYVTKIIGAGGCMVKNIAQHANGAQIKINSDKDSKKTIREVSVAINGSLEGKYRAAHLIIEQVEIFKNGGPIIQSGKVLNQNLAAQIQNSGLFKEKHGDRRDDKDRDHKSRRKYDSEPRDSRQRDRDSNRDRHERDNRDRNDDYDQGRKRKNYSRSRSKSNDQDRGEIRNNMNKLNDNTKHYSKNDRSQSGSNKNINVDQQNSNQRHQNHRSRSRSSKDRYDRKDRNMKYRDNEEQQSYGNQPSQTKTQVMEIENNYQYNKDQTIQPPNNTITNLTNTNANAEDYTNPDDPEDLPSQPNDTQQRSNENSDSFKQLSKFSSEANTHILNLGIQLSSNHPVIKDLKFVEELQEKIKGLIIDVDHNNAKFQVDGSVQQISQLIKLLGIKIINSETSYNQALAKLQSSEVNK